MWEGLTTPLKAQGHKALKIKSTSKERSSMSLNVDMRVLVSFTIDVSVATLLPSI